MVMDVAGFHVTVWAERDCVEGAALVMDGVGDADARTDVEGCVVGFGVGFTAEKAGAA
jgi:hypothetical protein